MPMLRARHFRRTSLRCGRYKGSLAGATPSLQSCPPMVRALYIPPSWVVQQDAVTIALPTLTQLPVALPETATKILWSLATQILPIFRPQPHPSAGVASEPVFLIALHHLSRSSVPI